MAVCSINMTREKTLERLHGGHERLRRVMNKLENRQIEKILGNWTIKDIIAHLSAWNWEQARAIDDLSANKKPLWWGLDVTDFNQREIEKRKDWNLAKIVQEWEESFAKLIMRVNELSREAWIHEVYKNGDDGLSASIESMLAYEYEGEDHEGGHAKQIEEFLLAWK